MLRAGPKQATIRHGVQAHGVRPAVTCRCRLWINPARRPSALPCAIALSLSTEEDLKGVGPRGGGGGGLGSSIWQVSDKEA